MATANLLSPALRRGAPSLEELRRVQRRRHFPTWATQALQLTIQSRAVDPILASGKTPGVPAIIRLAQRFPVLQRIPAYVIGVGFRPEHVRRPHAVSADP